MTIADRTTKRDNPFAKEYADFLRETKDHRLTVQLDDGLHRMMRVGAPDTGMFSWRVTTWPGYLATYGDIADGYMFSRIEDMINFFDRPEHLRNYYSDGAPSIDFRYWAEKLVSSGRRSRDVKVYSKKVFLDYVTDALDEHEEFDDAAQNEYDDIVEATRRVCAHNDVDFDEHIKRTRLLGGSRLSPIPIDSNDELQVEHYGKEIPAQSPKERREELLEEARRHSESEQDAHEWLADNPSVFGEDTWEVELRKYDIHFLFTCWAIDMTVQLWRTYEAERVVERVKRRIRDAALEVTPEQIGAVVEFAERGIARELGAIDHRHNYTDEELAAMRQRFDNARDGIAALRSTAERLTRAAEVRELDTEG